MTFSKALPLLLVATFLAQASTEPKIQVVPREKVQWGYLNPLRGELSPKAADLWGSRTQAGAAGVLVGFDKGFASPPHIHNVSYRGIVIEGLVHNDDPKANEMWLAPGSFWTQPAGEEHVTAALGATNLIYLEIESGPYLVHPSERQFDNNEHPLNLHASNMAWLGDAELLHINAPGVQASLLWGNTKEGELRGGLLKLPEGFNGVLQTSASELKVVVVQGSVEYEEESGAQHKLNAGSYIGAFGKASHTFSVKGSGEAVLYIRSNGHYRVDKRDI